MRKTDTSAVDLSRTRFLSKLLYNFFHLSQTGCSKRMSATKQSPGDVDRNTTAQCRGAFFHQASTLTFRTQAERFIMQQFRYGKSIMALDYIQVLRSDAGGSELVCYGAAVVVAPVVVLEVLPAPLPFAA